MKLFVDFDLRVWALGFWVGPHNVGLSFGPWDLSLIWCKFHVH